MHGRNKPIAYGQVGIRCMHCKRKLNCRNPVFGLSSHFPLLNVARWLYTNNGKRWSLMLNFLSLDLILS